MNKCEVTHLINEFMGYTDVKKTSTQSTSKSKSTPPYVCPVTEPVIYTDSDLFKIVDKINSLPMVRSTAVEFTVPQMHYFVITLNGGYSFFIQTVEPTRKSSMMKGIIEFIQWYNHHNTNT